MSGAQKFSLSLLISVVAFSGFAVLAWSGLFDYIETTFYLERVQSSVQLRVERISGQVEGFHRSNLDRFSAVLNQASVRRAFDVNQAREDIVERNSYFVALQSQLLSLDYVRFLDLGGNRLHFSTREGDFSEDGTSRVYTPLSILDVGEPSPIGDLAYDVDSENTQQLIGEGVPTADIVLSPVNNQFIYRFPVLDEFGLFQGTALFYLHAGGLSTWLVRDGLVGAGDEVDLISAADGGAAAGGVLVNGRGQWSVTLESTITENWSAVLLGERPVLAADGSTMFALFSSLPESGLSSPYTVLYLFPEDDLRMTDIMKIVLLAAIFLTVFLLVFLLFNLRQDAVVVLSDRVKRFQISLLREYMQNKQDLDFRRWRAELEDRREEVAVQIRRGIGRVRGSQKEEVDKLIDSSWDEILEVLGSRAGQATERGVDLDRLEDIVERVIGNLQSVGSPTVAPRPAPALSKPAEDTAAEDLTEEVLGEVEKYGEPIEVEELTEEDLAEVAELGEPIEVEELTEEDLAEEVLGEVERFGEPIEVEELTEEEFAAEELGEVEELGEPIEVEELTEEDLAEEEVGEVAELGEPIEVEELTEEEFAAEELGEVAELGEPIEVEELTEEDLAEEELGEVAGLGEPIEVEELAEEEPAQAEVIAEEMVAGAEAVEEIEEVEEAIPEVAVSGDVLDEAAELEWLVESETLDIEETSLEDLEAETEETVPLLEGESIAGDENGDLEELEEIDSRTAEGTPSGEPAELEELDEEEVAEVAASEAVSVVTAAAIGADEVEELDSVEPEMPADAGDLESARPGITPFMAGTFSFGKGTVVNLTPGHPPTWRPEEDGAVPADDDIELLGPDESSVDEPAEVPTDPAAIPSGMQMIPTAPLVSEGPIHFTDIRSMVTPEYEIASVRDILDRLHIDKNIIIDRDGIVEIDRKVYGAQSRVGDDETRQLVDSVVGDQAGDVTAGVEELFGGEAMDLFADLSPVQDSDSLSRETGRSVVRFGDRGFDYDGFLRGYHATESGVIKSLVTFTRHWRARVGVLLGAGEDELVPKYGLGLEESCLDTLKVSHSSGIYRNVLQKRLVLFVDRPLRRVEYFRGLCSDEQLSYFQKALFLPVVIQGEEGYALLGLPDGIGSLDEAFETIVPLLTSVAAVM